MRGWLLRGARSRLLVLAILCGALGTAAAPAAAAVNPTSIAISCAPTSVPSGSATSCTATVTDEAVSSPSVPTGDVTFSPVPATGSFSASSSCALAAAGATSASCVITFTATEGGDYSLSADYAGDSGHHASIGTTTVTAIDPTSTSFACDTTNPPINTSATCTAMLSDTGSPEAPIGAVTFTSDQSTGTFASPSQCPWSPAASGMGGTATCQVVFSATTAGTYTLTASYGGDRTHAASAGTAQLTVTTVATGGGPGASNPGGLSVPVGSSKPTAPVLLPGSIKIAAATAKVSTRRKAGVRLACSGAAGAQCAGILTLTAPIKVKVKVKAKVKVKLKVKVKVKKKVHGKTRTRTVTRKRTVTRTRTKTVTETELLKLGSVVYTVRARTTHAVSVTLSKRAFALLTKARPETLKTSASAAGVVRTVVLTPAHKAKPKRKKPKHKPKRKKPKSKHKHKHKHG